MDTQQTSIQQKNCKPDRMSVFRVLASLFVLGGGLFWSWVVFAGYSAFYGSTLVAAGGAAIWVALTAIVFVVGLAWERVAAGILGAAALAGIGYGLFMHWETGVWFQFGSWIILPIVISAALYLLAAREYSVCVREARDERMAAMPAARAS